MKTIALLAIAGLAAAASAQSIQVSFVADASEINVGDTVNWDVSVVGLDYANATAYLGGFVGSFNASDSTLGNVTGWVSNFGGNATTPTFNGASINGINSFNSALLGTDNQALEVGFSFSVEATAEGVLDYSFDGVWSYFASDFIFGLPDEYTEGDVQVASDRVNIVPAPGAVALLGLGGLVAGRRRR